MSYKITPRSGDTNLTALKSAHTDSAAVIRSRHYVLDYSDMQEETMRALKQEIWKLFTEFAEACQSTLSRRHRRQEIQYKSSYGFPICTLPNETEIICINSFVPADEHYIDFVWLDDEVRYG